MKTQDRDGAGVAEAGDTELVTRVLAGDSAAFATLVRRHERRVFRVTLAVSGCKEDAEEAMQDAFIKAYRHLAQFRHEAKFTTWLTSIAVNEALQRRNTRKNSVSLDDPAAAEAHLIPQRCEPWHTDPEKIASRQELRLIVEQTIQSLPLLYREPLMLRDVEEMNTEEAASMLGLAVPAFKSRLLRGRLMVREALAARLETKPGLAIRAVRSAANLGKSLAARFSAAGREA